MKGFLHTFLPWWLLLNACTFVLASYAFGSGENSRIEYDHARGKFRKQFNFSLEIKTNESDGIIFYASDKEHTNVAAVYMANGYVIYRVRSNKDNQTLRSLNPLNDDQWHAVVFTHDQSTQELFVDDISQGQSSFKPAGRLDIEQPFMLGGVREEEEFGVKENIKTVQSFNGCIRNFYMNKKPMEKPRKIGVKTCPDSIEEGNYFNDGYITLKNKFVVGEEIDIKMDIKPRNISGLLLAVHGKKDYLALEMYNGAIKFTVENGRGPISTTFSPDRTHFLCDGRWHTIQAVKSKNVVSLSVNNRNIAPSVGDHRSKSTDTGGALFLGGHRVIAKLRGITARVPFVGCIKNFRINNDLLTMNVNMRRVNVTLGECPTK